MKLHLVLVLAAGFCLVANEPQAGPGKGDSPLQGIWGIVSLEINGEPVDVTGLKEARLTVAGERYSFRLGEGRLEMTHKVNPNASPSTLDMTVTEGPLKGKTYYAVYELAEGRLKICRNVEPEKERPSGFTCMPGSGLMVIVWERLTP
ncbi:MAG: TIGR03067 domain-containing protein [Gemmataceae bacterium]|nr:TIGR03067 domain-containing protein [Gemmataceae bacterium]